MRSLARRLFLLFVLLASVGAGIAFVYAVTIEWKARESQSVSCWRTFVPNTPSNFSYIQLETREQDPTEPYFNGGVFFNLGNAYGGKPMSIRAKRSASRTYGESNVVANLNYDEVNKVLWMSKKP